MTAETTIIRTAVTVLLVAPMMLLAALAIPSLVRRPLAERAATTCARLTTLAAFVAAFVALIIYLTTGRQAHMIHYGDWFAAGQRGFAFDFLLDGFALGFAALATAICGVVAAFSARYLHRERGFNRYFVQFALFVLGIILVAIAGSIEVLFAGWELVGLSSALLVGFFHERREPVVNALRLFAVYRASDAAMLAAAILLHHLAGSGSLSWLFGASGTPPPLSRGQVLLIALLLLVAVAAKSALLPFSGWLPRAMEGPTPSSGVFYGGLSTHAGCFLLLRSQPLLGRSSVARLLTGLVGAGSALHATLSARVQTDIKSALAYASLTQVGMIVVEIALGLPRLAFAHMLGHLCFRLLQFLSAPNILHDLHQLECDSDHRSFSATRRVVGRARGPVARGLYLLALERGFVDELVDLLLVRPFEAVTRQLERFDRLLCAEATPRHPAGPAEEDVR